MIEAQNRVSAESKANSEHPESDLTGRKGIVGNVLASWAGYLVVVVAGFVMPYLIDRRLGIEMLGVWDFAWSTVSYFGLVQIGIVGSVNRFVALHRAEGNMAGVNGAVSSVTAVLFLMAALIVALTAVAYAGLPVMVTPGLKIHLSEIRWAVVILGVEMAVGTALSVYGGVLTGFHKWKLYTAIQSIGSIISITAMITVLLFGGGICALALAHFAGEMSTSVLRLVFARRVCTGLKIRLEYVRWQTARDMMKFGTKAFLPQLSDLLVNQTTSILVATHLGPSALALFSRPRNLVMQSRTLIHKMAAVLVPAASSMQAQASQKELQDLIIKATRYSAFLMLPVTVFLATMGGPVLHVWMGPAYANSALMAVVALGYSSFIVQLPAMALLGGMNKHGKPGVAHFITSLVTALFVFIAVGPLRLGLVGVAIAGTVPLAITYSIWMPLYSSKQLAIPFGFYFRRAYGLPLIAAVVLTGCLLPIRLILSSQPRIAVIVAAFVTAGVLAPLYWIKVVPSALKNKIVSHVPILKFVKR
jgi:O-antigen/teichoic acid export membrane protein